MTFNEYISRLNGKRIGVIGAGVSNVPLINELLNRNCDVTVCDKRNKQQLGELAERMLSAGAKFSLGDEYLENLDFDIIFRTPGIHPDIPQLRAAKAVGARITSEMEAFFEICSSHIIAVTGSDGKTTTTTVISELLKAGGYKVHVGGNIGTPLLTQVDSFSKNDYVVLELSSFQLHSMVCSPEVAVITNISPNHLDVHPDMADYVDAKKMIYRNGKSPFNLVLNADDPYTDEIKSEAKGKILTFSRLHEVEDGAFVKNGVIYMRHAGQDTEVMNASDILIPGEHNVENYLAAFSAVGGLVPAEKCAKVAKSFGGVKHRLELIREFNGVRYYNDSIASGPTRTIAGLRSFEQKPILIAGGRDKGVTFEKLGEEIAKRAKAVFLTGETAQGIKAAIEAAPGYNPLEAPVVIIDDFAETVIAASRYATAGDIVVLSPASTSFDRFKDFAERGEFFRKIVMELE